MDDKNSDREVGRQSSRERMRNWKIDLHVWLVRCYASDAIAEGCAKPCRFSRKIIDSRPTAMNERFKGSRPESHAVAPVRQARTCALIRGIILKPQVCEIGRN